MKISIYPKSSDREKSVPLLFSITGLTSSNIIVSAFESLTLKEWERRQKNKSDVLVKRLDSKAKAIEKIVNELIDEDIFSPALLKERYNDKFKPKKKVEEPDVLPTAPVKDTIKEVCEKITHNLKRIHSNSHLRKFKTLISDLDAFKPGATFSDLTPLFWEQFYNYLITKKSREKNKVGVSNNTIKSTHLKMIRIACKYAIKWGIAVPQSYLDYKVKSVTTEKIVLDWQEVQHIEKCTLFLEIQKKVRDLYIFSCYTGLRHQDLKLNKSNFQFEGDKVFLNIITKKSTKSLRIMLTQQALLIAKKYDFELPSVSNQKCNHHLKLIAKHAKLNRLVQHTTYKGSERIVEIKEVYNYVSMHQARHNFSIQFLKLNSKKHGLKAMMTLQQILTHSSLKTTEIYGRMLEGDQDQLISEFNN